MLGVVNNEEWERELQRNHSVVPNGTNDSRDSNTNDKGSHQSPSAGRGSSPNRDNEERKAIASLAILGHTTNEIMEMTGASRSSVNAYRNGANGSATYQDKNPELVDHITRVKNKISRKARKVILKSIDKLDDEKLNKCSPSELAHVARSMANVAKDMEPPQVVTLNDNRKVQFIMFAPQMKEEQAYDAIDVSAMDMAVE